MSETAKEENEAPTLETIHRFLRVMVVDMKLDAALQKIKAVERALECPICTDIFTPPIKICPTGHAFCQSCELKECPLCKQRFNGGRGYHLEAIVELLFAKCSNSGCGTTLRRVDIPEHEINCGYRPVICDCGEKVNFMDYVSHLEQKHNVLARSLKTTSLKPWELVSYELSNSQISELKDANKIIFQERVCLTYRGYSFLAHGLFKGESFFAFVQQLSPPHEENEYVITVNVEIKDIDMDDVIASYTIPVHSIRKSDLEIMESRKVAVFPVKNVWTGINKKEWSVRYSINFSLSLLFKMLDSD